MKIIIQKFKSVLYIVVLVQLILLQTILILKLLAVNKNYIELQVA